MRVVEGDMTLVGPLFFGNSVQAQRQFQQHTQQMWEQNGLSMYTSRYEEGARALAQQFTSQAVEQQISNAIAQSTSLFMPDTIYRFETPSQMQMARPQMQRYIMAQPDYRKLYHDNRADGYSDSYIDSAPGIIGQGHAEYEHVMGGRLTFTEDGFTVNHYSSAFKDEHTTHLSVVDGNSVYMTWLALKDSLDQRDEDPGNPWGGRL